MTMLLRSRTGSTITLHLNRWRDHPNALEQEMLGTLPDPVLDIGCGPGRLAAALAARGRMALGIDPSPEAVVEATRRGASVLQRSIFDDLPGTGRWGAALLLDGNIGIGGSPTLLLKRVGRLLRPGGVVLIEVEGPDQPSKCLTVRVEATGHGANRARAVGPWFPWATVNAKTVETHLVEAGLALIDIRNEEGRWFATATHS